MWQYNSVTVGQCDSVTVEAVWQCGSVTVEAANVTPPAQRNLKCTGWQRFGITKIIYEDISSDPLKIWIGFDWLNLRDCCLCDVLSVCLAAFTTPVFSNMLVPRLTSSIYECLIILNWHEKVALNSIPRIQNVQCHTEKYIIDMGSEGSWRKGVGAVWQYLGQEAGRSLTVEKYSE